MLPRTESHQTRNRTSAPSCLFLKSVQESKCRPQAPQEPFSLKQLVVLKKARLTFLRPGTLFKNQTPRPREASHWTLNGAQSFLSHHSMLSLLNIKPDSGLWASGPISLVFVCWTLTGPWGRTQTKAQHPDTASPSLSTPLKTQGFSNIWIHVIPNRFGSSWKQKQYFLQLCIPNSTRKLAALCLPGHTELNTISSYK